MRGICKGWNRGTMAVVLCLALLCGSLGLGVNVATAASKGKLNQRKLTLTIGASYKLKISGTKKDADWESSANSVASVSSEGKVKAKKNGTATITATIGENEYTCKVTVNKANSQEEKVLEIANKKRAAKGLNALTLDPALQKAAKARAKETVKKNSHDRPNGKKFYTILGSYHVTYHACGENIAQGYTNAKKVMNAWMHSSGHKANILDSSYSRIGIGLYKAPNTKYKYYWVQLFAD